MQHVPKNNWVRRGLTTKMQKDAMKLVETGLEPDITRSDKELGRFCKHFWSSLKRAPIKQTKFDYLSNILNDFCDGKGFTSRFKYFMQNYSD